MNIEKDVCDYYLEVYYWEHTLVALVEKVVTKKEKVVLASVGLYRDYELEFEDQLKILTDLRENLMSAYMNWPDGEVAVELTIKEEFINA
jgi:hypothetical protein